MDTGVVVTVPETRYATSGDVHIAYQVLGDRSLDLVHVPPFVSNLELQWDDAAQRRYLERLAGFARLIMFDKRGTGLSDRVDIATLEERMDDVRAVMDAAGSERAVIFGSSEGGALAVLFAATYPERVASLVLYGAYPRATWAPDYPDGLHPDVMNQMFAQVEQHWGRNGLEPTVFYPRGGNRPEVRESMARWERLSASPGAALALLRMIAEVDVRPALPAIRTPSLVIYRTGDRLHAAGSRYLGEHLRGAKVVELPGDVYFPYVGDQEAITGEIEEFVTGHRPSADPDRILVTVLFTDIAGSTAQAGRLGDQRWKALLDEHYVQVDRELDRHRGRKIKTTGDGLLATFDGPARAIRCACAIIRAAQTVGLEVRAGLHTGEVDLVGQDIAGIAVHIGQRVCSLAGPGQVLVSRTVADLVAGSGLVFEDRGYHRLKGISGSWKVFAVEY